MKNRNLFKRDDQKVILSHFIFLKSVNIVFIEEMVVMKSYPRLLEACLGNRVSAKQTNQKYALAVRTRHSGAN